MRKLAARFSEATEDGVYRVVAADNVASEWDPELLLAVQATGDTDKQIVDRLRAAGVRNVDWVEAADLEVGDVIAVRRSKSEAVVLFRETDQHHALLLTNRCNSNCLMCSQPPTTHDDSWLVSEALETIRHIRRPPAVLGLTGGEPLLLGSALRLVVDAVASHLPSTQIEVLTNGRLLADPKLSRSILTDLQGRVTWLVPLYGHADYLHDFVVQAPGAFDETLGGLLSLQEHRQAIQLRIVLIEPVLRVLPELCRFIGRNLPFVREVALMACEPIGFALANRSACEVDLLDWTTELEQSARILRRHRVPFLFMNAPLCALPQLLRADAHRSISDWKRVYADECARCVVREQCSGLFAWHESGWKPTRIHAIEEATA